MKKQAGASGFTDYGYGTNANRVFRDLVEEAQYEHGSRGYTGTIAEKDGFTMATREVMTQAQAREYADKHYDDYDKWGDAGCVAFGEEKVLVSKDFEVKVKARNKDEAMKKVREKMMGGKKRAGATIEVEITWNATKLTTPAGKRKITTERSNGDVYFLKHYDAHTKYSSKKEAVAALKKILETTKRIDPGQVVRIVKVQDQGAMSYAESSKLATFTVVGKRIQKKVGKVKGYYFFGWASS